MHKTGLKTLVVIVRCLPFCFQSWHSYSLYGRNSFLLLLCELFQKIILPKEASCEHIYQGSHYFSVFLAITAALKYEQEAFTHCSLACCFSDVSRASHRKPKLPRFNIGVASDDEDNGELQKNGSDLFPSHFDKNDQLDSSGTCKVQGDGSQKGELIHASPAVTQVENDLLNINVTIDDADPSFAHFNLDELGDSILLNDSITDIPMVTGNYGTGEEASKSLLESVLVAKPSRDPSTKKPLNSQSVIVSGAKSEKCHVKCRLCPEKFSSIEGLEDHLQTAIHVVKKFQCDLCGRKFAALRDVERHRRIHTGEKPFSCDICNKAFSRKDNLKSHKRQHFKNNQKPPEN